MFCWYTKGIWPVETRSHSKTCSCLAIPYQIENTKIITELREEIARLREKLALSSSGVAGGPNKEDVDQMEVSPLSC